MKIWRTRGLRSGDGGVVRRDVGGAVTLGVPSSHHPGTPGVTTLAAGGGCAEYMCGTNHNQVLL